ncbi:DUF6768 family protein [Marinicella meishanensis]|uniref:DUF6768 family protein n=1 Tax=Marinicella meishanensis TaxID=2873263 RepID=UPI001CBD5A57|nr:DUF6768 family protein [Marinicella sp. NBU2979]
MNIDEQIKQALGEELQGIKSNNDRIDANPLRQVQVSLTGKMGWIYALVMVFIMLMVAGAVYCAVQFYHAQELKELMGWGIGIIILVLLTQISKMWYWTEMGHNRVIREVKLLELQVARLYEKLND